MSIIDWRNLDSREGFDLRAEKHYDQDTRPDDMGLYPDGCHTPKQVKAWENDDWQYVGLIVTASIDGVQLGDASLWGIEDGHWTSTDENDNITETCELDSLYNDEYLNDLIDEAIYEARKRLATIIEKNKEQGI